MGPSLEFCGRRITSHDLNSLGEIPAACDRFMIYTSACFLKSTMNGAVLRYK